jgi:crotonobetainyl-CoA:carnitine CoA-transferase CaiB-like acyl-CoA transferase
MNLRHPSQAVADGLPPGAPRGRAARDQLGAELLALLHSELQTNTALVAKLAGRITNDTLEVATYVFDANGVVTNTYKTAAGCIEVENLGANNMTVTARASAGDGTAPKNGSGVRIVPAHSCRVVPLASHTWTIYGTPADTVSVAVFTAGAAPGRGLGSVNSGGA